MRAHVIEIKNDPRQNDAFMLLLPMSARHLSSATKNDQIQNEKRKSKRSMLAYAMVDRIMCIINQFASQYTPYTQYIQKRAVDQMQVYLALVNDFIASSRA